MKHLATTVLVAIAPMLAWGCDREPGPLGPRPLPPLSSSVGTDLESNNTCADAQDLGTVTLPLEVDGSLSGFPFPTGDVDFFRLTSTPGALVRVELEGQSTGRGTLGDPFLGSFDSGCNAIALDDDGGVGANSRLAITIPDDGVIVLAVTRCCDAGFTFGGSGIYRLTVNEVVPPPNDDFVDALEIPEPLPSVDTIDLAVATREAGEPTPSCAAFFGPVERTAWLAFTPLEDRSVSARILSAPFSTVVAIYTGDAVESLAEVSCASFGGPATFGAQAGTVYRVQVGGLFGQGGLVDLEVADTPPPLARFGFFPFDPSVHDVVQFFDFSFDPGGLGIESREWDFGDGATETGPSPMHQYVLDGSYETQLTVTTPDGRSASTTQTVVVTTHDVAITRLLAPRAASAGQTRQITVGVNSRRYDETVEVRLLKSVPRGFEFVAVLVQSVPVRSANRTTDFDFSYTFTADDARLGKVTFKAIANVLGARDALPADNEAIAPPTKVNR